MDNLTIVERVELGRALLPNNTRYDVVATRHNQDWPGTDSPWTFAVEQWGYRDQFYCVLQAWGFFREQDCFDFLSSIGHKRYDVVDRKGRPDIEWRTCRGVPDAYIMRQVYQL